jgi:DNA-binding MarR family transcriptional regulator/DNA-binding NarL/FixJ family response regulator
MKPYFEYETMAPPAQERSALLIARCDAAIAHAREVAAATGLRILSHAPPERGAETIDRTARAGLVLIDLSEERDGDADALSAIAAQADRRCLPVIACVRDDTIDLAAATLMGAGVQLLCAPSSLELAGAIALAGGGAAPVLNEATRDAERRRLEHLHAEVARIAETLAGMARHGGAPVHVAAAATLTGGWGGPQADAQDETTAAADIRKAIQARRMRDRFFDRTLFADPAWDMLLDLYAAHLERARVSVSSLCIAAAVPPTTALRWIATMQEAGLFERQSDPFDKRRAFMALTEKALAAMRGYMAAARAQGLAIA